MYLLIGCFVFLWFKYHDRKDKQSAAYAYAYISYVENGPKIEIEEVYDIGINDPGDKVPKASAHYESKRYALKLWDLFSLTYSINRQNHQHDTGDN